MPKERNILRAILIGYLIEVALVLLWCVCALLYKAFMYDGLCSSSDPADYLKAHSVPCSFSDYMFEAAANYFTTGLYILTFGFLLVLPLSLLAAIALHGMAEAAYSKVVKNSPHSFSHH